MPIRPSSIGEYIDTRVGVRPIAQAAGTVNGPAIIRTGFRSCEAFHMTGTVSGAPSAVTVATKLQASADGSTGWADIGGATLANLTAASTQASAALNLDAVPELFIRVVSTVSFTGGTAPTALIAATVVLGGHRSHPQ